MTDQPTAAVVRKRRERQRKADGLVVLQVVVNEFELSCALVEHGLLQGWNQDDPAALRDAAEDALALLPSLKVTRDGSA